MPYVECNLDMAKLGENLRAWRQRHCLTQEQLATSMQLSGICCDRCRIAHIESGRIRMSVYELYVLVAAFGLDIKELF